MNFRIKFLFRLPKGQKLNTKVCLHHPPTHHTNFEGPSIGLMKVKFGVKPNLILTNRFVQKNLVRDKKKGKRPSLKLANLD